MTRWKEISCGRTGHEYAARFDQLAASGADVHGEANLVTAFAATGSRVLDAGCGTGRVALRLSALGYDCVGVDLDPSMLEVARSRGPEIPWYEGDLASLQLPGEAPYDLIVAAGNVMPLLAAGTGPAVVAHLVALLGGGGVLVAGFGLDAAHLPIPEPTVDLAGYDAWCTAAGLALEQRFSGWDGDRYDGGGYAVSVHRLTSQD
jgi:SAM-dependent methyltransferase